MWLFEQRGFNSVVAYDPKFDTNKSSKFRDIAPQAGTHLLVRARIKEDLDWLKEFRPNLVIETDKSADYSFRCVIDRKAFKRAMINAVDEIDYGSHFKEVAEKRSPEAKGRHSAMMSCWSAMAKLQPYSPYGGWSTYSTGGYTGSTSSSKGSSKSGTTSSTKGPSPLPQAFKGFETLTDYYVGVINGEASEDSYRHGHGPHHGFQVGMEVHCYYGTGTVTEVQERGNSAGFGTSDIVKVETDKGSKHTFASNYLTPVFDPTKDFMPDELSEEVNAALDASDGDSGAVTLDEMRDFLVKEPLREFIEDTPDYMYTHSNDEAFELLTRVQEHLNRFKDLDAVTDEIITEYYAEITWENLGTDEARKKAFGSGDLEPPAKYEHEAVALFSKSEN